MSYNQTTADLLRENRELRAQKAELVAALQDACAMSAGTLTTSQVLNLIARAESVAPDHIPDAAKMVSATPAKHCEDCAPEFGCWDGGESCYKQPLQSSTPAKHPDTEEEAFKIVQRADKEMRRHRAKQGGEQWTNLVENLAGSGA